MSHVLGYLSLALYAASFVCYARILYVPNIWVGRAASVLLAAGLFLKYYELLDRSRIMHTVPYDDLYGSMSLFAWLFGITYLVLEIFHRQRTVGAFITFLMFAWVALLGAFAPAQAPNAAPERGALFALHVTLNTWSYAAFALSFALSLVYLIQHALLRSRRLSTAFWRFPALEVLDRMARSSVYLGLGLIAVGVPMGLIWAHRVSGTYPLGDPKVLVTAVILVVYVAYLWLSRSAQWRGSRAALLCALNFALVLFSYTVVNFYLTRFHRYF
ncbi:MAG TPA: cytochrome c biogenesis protein CcsA [Candidatus Acidoferrales bacterium]|jgi:HemX protein|nr:cytochrome c biogenesis protein CcsA [Candidatus Acidoferrales bacterium]